jgi:phosphoglucosamine mutase
MINVRADAEAKARLKTDEVILSLVAECESEMGGRGRILIRPSGTEPLIRVMTEGESPELAESICKKLADGIGKRLG